MKWMIVLLITLGTYFLLASRFTGIYAPARKALRGRAPRPLTHLQVLQNQLAEKITPSLNLDPIEKAQTETLLQNLGHTESPELFQARAMAKGICMGLACVVLLLVSVPFGLAAMLLVGVWFYRKDRKSLEMELAIKRSAIERELPQFASTIRQSLGTTRDIVAILTSYRRVCGPALAGEIDKTLNDMMTGNSERALKALECRVSSAKLGQLTRGLVAVLRGDDQKAYFDMLVSEYRKSQDEQVERELLQRPKKLTPYMALLFFCLILMLVSSLGADLLNNIHQLFG